jgi:hypothetical protein
MLMILKVPEWEYNQGWGLPRSRSGAMDRRHVMNVEKIRNMVVR